MGAIMGDAAKRGQDGAGIHRPASPMPAMTPDPRAAALEATQRWLDRAVIGLNLCPFAKAVQVKRQIRWVVSEASEPQALADELAQELALLHRADPNEIETTLLIHPQVLQDFRDYNDFLDVADAVVAELGLEGELQVASFHPRYRFAGTRADAVENFSNRSPHPTLHLLREASIAQAVAAFPDAADIYERNIETLRRLGVAGWRQLLA